MFTKWARTWRRWKRVRQAKKQVNWSWEKSRKSIHWDRKKEGLKIEVFKKDATEWVAFCLCVEGNKVNGRGGTWGKRENFVSVTASSGRWRHRRRAGVVLRGISCGRSHHWLMVPTRLESKSISSESAGSPPWLSHAGICAFCKCRRYVR